MKSKRNARSAKKLWSQWTSKRGVGFAYHWRNLDVVMSPIVAAIFFTGLLIVILLRLSPGMLETLVKFFR